MKRENRRKRRDYIRANEQQKIDPKYRREDIVNETLDKRERVKGRGGEKRVQGRQGIEKKKEV